MTKLNYIAALFLLLCCYVLISDSGAASEKSVLDEINVAEDRFDNRSVPLVKQVTEESGAGKRGISGRVVSGAGQKSSDRALQMQQLSYG